MSNLIKINYKQKEILGEYMSEHSQLAKGMLTCSAQGRATANKLWENLTIKLNASGPPTKDAKAWRKVYADQKQMVKKKVTYNKLSRKRTGGGPHDEKALSQTEELILEAAGIEDEVDGLKTVNSFGCGSPEREINDGPTTSQNCVLEGDLSLLLTSDNEQDSPVSKKPRAVIKLNQRKQTKTSLLKENMDSVADYHKQVLEKLNTLVELKQTKIQFKERTLRMKEKEFNVNMGIKSIELKIKQKELEQLKSLNY